MMSGFSFITASRCRLSSFSFIPRSHPLCPHWVPRPYTTHPFHHSPPFSPVSSLASSTFFGDRGRKIANTEEKPCRKLFPDTGPTSPAAHLVSAAPRHGIQTVIAHQRVRVRPLTTVIGHRARQADLRIAAHESTRACIVKKLCKRNDDKNKMKKETPRDRREKTSRTSGRKKAKHNGPLQKMPATGTPVE